MKVRVVHWREIYSERIWRCDCGAPHFLIVARPVMVEDEDDDFYQYLALETFTEPVGILERLKIAWRILRGERWCDGDFHLDSKTARELCDELTRAADEYEAWERRNDSKRPNG